jgi:hypothetical protein
LRAIAATANPDVSGMIRELRQRAHEWRTAARRYIAEARQILRKLITDRLLITPLDEGTCELSGQADYGKLFNGIVLRASSWHCPS